MVLSKLKFVGLYFVFFQRKQEMAKEIAKDAIQNLAFEPSKSPEGHLLQSIEMELAHIEDNIKKQSTK